MKFSIPALLFCLLVQLAPALAMAQAGPQAGTVAESIDAGGYTYLRLEEPDIWLATSSLQVATGDQVEYSGGMEMRDFHSKALDRAFESIWFVQEVRVVGKDIAALHDTAGQAGGFDHAGIGAPDVASAPAAGDIPALDGGATVAGLVADPGSLEGQTVRLRARVTKVSANIMDRNWITLQDGSGTNPEDKLIATSTQSVSAGDVVIASGTLRSDVDIGSGYRYEVLLEDARFE